ALPMQDIDECSWILASASLYDGGTLWKTVNGGTGGPLLFAPLCLILYSGKGLNYTTIRIFGLICCVLPSIFFVWKTLVVIRKKDNAPWFCFRIISMEQTAISAYWICYRFISIS